MIFWTLNLYRTAPYMTRECCYRCSVADLLPRFIATTERTWNYVTRVTSDTTHKEQLLILCSVRLLRPWNCDFFNYPTETAYELPSWLSGPMKPEFQCRNKTKKLSSRVYWYVIGHGLWWYVFPWLTKFSATKLDNRMFCLTSVATIRHLPEVIIIWVIGIQKMLVDRTIIVNN
jgi:hypothetical protein